MVADLRRTRRIAAACSAVSAVTVAEEEANQKRWEESGKQNNVDSWRWTLNWDTINDNIVVGSCPRSTSDIVRTLFLIILRTCARLAIDALFREFIRISCRLGYTEGECIAGHATSRCWN